MRPRSEEAPANGLGVGAQDFLSQMHVDTALDPEHGFPELRRGRI